MEKYNSNYFCDGSSSDSTEWQSTSSIFAEVTSTYFNPENYFYVNRELPKYIKRKLSEYNLNKDFTDHYLYFCSTIYYLRHCNRKYQNQDFVPINYKTMTTIISKTKYSEIVANLTEWEIIESNLSYSSGNFSKGYKLLPPYDSDIRRVPVRDNRINNKINRYKMSSFKEIKKLPFPYQYLSMTNTWLEMDYRRASYYNTHTYLLSDPNVYNSNFYSISAFKDGDYRFTVDTTGFRTHTNLTNLKSDFRYFITVEGEPLAQVDIKNSQPLFFYLVIKDNSTIPEDEKLRYKDIVESGKFYEFFMERLGIDPNQRSKIKHTILSAIFFDINRKKTSRYVKVLEEEFPSIAEYISELRSKDYRELSHLLQRKESQFVINHVVQEFINRYGQKHEYIGTIHDSIVVKINMLDEAEALMLDCFEKEGLRPQLAKEIFSR